MRSLLRSNMYALFQRYKAGIHALISVDHDSWFKRLLLIASSGLLWLVAEPTEGAVIVYDQITAPNTPVFLKVQTRGRFFAEGGRRVTLSVNKDRTFKLLTGGDGFGYVKYTPAEPGRFTISAASNCRDSHA